MKGSENKQLSPRLDYLSYSKKKLFERSEELFSQVYFKGIELDSTERMMFGKDLADALEDGARTSENEMIAHALLYLPKYPRHEYKVRVKFDGISFLSAYDGYDSKQKGIGEYKTGRSSWTQSRVDRDEQLTFYAMTHYFKWKKLPKWIRLHWLNTATGEIKTFEANRSVVQILRYFNECKATWKSIQKLIKEYKNESQ